MSNKPTSIGKGKQLRINPQASSILAAFPGYGSGEDMIPLISLRPLTGRDLFSSSSTSPWTVLSIPFLMETGFAPEVTLSSPRLMISRARTEAVVVPSPAESFVLLATCKREEHSGTEIHYNNEQKRRMEI